LHSIIGFSEIIKDQSFGPLGSENYVEYANEIHQNGSNLLDLLNSILEMSKLESGALQLNEIEFDLTSLFARQRDFVQRMPQASERKIEFILSESLPLIRADNGILNQTLQHVISNAVKFTSDNGEISIAAQNCSYGGIVFIITDNGIGIAAENIPNLTKIFYQADSAHDRAHDGTGLGLALVDGYVRAHGGQLEIKSKLGEGTSVFIYWPAERCRHATVKTPRGHAAPELDENLPQPNPLPAIAT
jgi:two-component system cell cycle sensor histidine kinase PleC